MSDHDAPDAVTHPIQVPAEAGQDNDSPEKKPALLEKVVAFYRKTLVQTNKALTWLVSQGFRDGAVAETFGLGYSNGTLTGILPSTGTIRRQLLELGILDEHGQELLRDCVVFPLLDAEQRPVSLYGRHNRRHTEHLLANSATGLWNLPAARVYPDVYLASTILDGISLCVAGYPHQTAMVLGKGDKQRVVPIGKTALRYLENYLIGARPYLVKSAGERALFVGFDGKRLSYGAFRTAVRGCARLAGVELNVTPHTFRRSCATELIRGGANMYHVKELLGHESLDTLKHYARLTIVDLKNTHEKCHPRERENDSETGIASPGER